MKKWSYYANEILRSHPLRGDDFSGLNFSQALLQHYGWRSFFVDFSKSYKVACWFASHKFQESRSTEITEDVNEECLFLVHKNASYQCANDILNGHIYIVSIEKLKELGHEVIDLTVLPEDIVLRPRRQFGWLVGPLSWTPNASTLNLDAIVAHVEAPIKVLKELSKLEFTDLFPSSSQDFFLKFLEALPWSHIEDSKIDIFFRRAIEIPDYHYKPLKKYPPECAFYKKLWLSEIVKRYNLSDERISRINKSVFFRVDESAFFHSELCEAPLSNLKKILEKKKNIIIEADNLILFPAQMGHYLYTKGISIYQEADDIFIEAIEIYHQGRSVKGLRTNLGYCYRWKDNTLVRKSHPQDCPCGDIYKHERLKTILAGIDPLLPKAKKISSNSMLIPFD